jgi:hypothetical protein
MFFDTMVLSVLLLVRCIECGIALGVCVSCSILALFVCVCVCVCVSMYECGVNMCVCLCCFFVAAMASG